MFGSFYRSHSDRSSSQSAVTMRYAKGTKLWIQNVNKHKMVQNKNQQKKSTVEESTVANINVLFWEIDITTSSLFVLQ